MKVLFLCMAFVAVSLAMPVAEDSQPQPDVPVAPEVKDALKPEAENKPEIIQQEKAALPNPAEPKKPEDKPELKSKPDILEEKKPEVSNPEYDIAVKPIEPEVKSAGPAEIPQPEAKAVSVNEDKKSDAAPLAPEQKPEVANEAESKPELKTNEPEPKPVEIAPKEEVPAKVEEVKIEPAVKSVIKEELIDVVSAFKNPAKVADDVIDPIAINPISSPQAVITGKSAKPEEKEAPKSPEQGKSAEPLEEEKPKEATPVAVPEAPIGKSTETEISPIDSQRVIRDLVVEKSPSDIEKPVAEVKKIEPTAVEPAAVEPKPEIPVISEEKREVKKAKPEEDVKEEKIGDVIKPEVKKPEAAKPEAAKPEKPEAPKETEAEPKPITQPLSSAPKSSEESIESGEKKGDSAEKDSSEESGEAPKSK